MSLFIYVTSFVVVALLLWVGSELYRVRTHLDAHNATARRTKTRRRLSPQLFDQETA